MTRSGWGLAALALLLLGPAPARAQQAHEIKLKEAGKGAYVGVVRRLDQIQFKVTDNDGKVQDVKNVDKAEGYVFRETVVEKPEGQRPTRLERQYDQAAAGAEGELKPLAFEGKTVLIGEKDGQYGFKVKGGDDVAGEDAAPLEREFNKDKDDKAGLDKLLMPQKAVKVGETWKVPVEVLIKIFAKKGGTEFDADRATGTGKLIRVYKQGGKQFGVFDFQVELPLKAIEMEKKQFKAEAGSKITFAISQDVCIDGSDASYTMTIALHIHGVAAVPDADNPQGRVTLDLRHTGSKSLKELAE
jgi:hypothetical protein